MIGATTINSRQLLGLRSVTFDLVSERPPAMRIITGRDPAKGPNALGFALTTHGDGTTTKFDGSIQLRDVQGSPTYRVEFWNASCASYKTAASAEATAAGREEWVIIAPKFKIEAGGKLAEFESRETTRHEIPN